MREPIAICSSLEVARPSRPADVSAIVARAREILGPDAAHQGAGGDAVGGRHDLAGDQRRHREHAVGGAQALGERVEVGQALGPGCAA